MDRAQSAVRRMSRNPVPTEQRAKPKPKTGTNTQAAAKPALGNPVPKKGIRPMKLQGDIDVANRERRNK